MTTLHLSPLTNSEVFARANQSDYGIASDVRSGHHNAESFHFDYFNRNVAENHALDTARQQRVYKHPDGPSGLIRDRRQS